MQFLERYFKRFRLTYGIAALGLMAGLVHPAVCDDSFTIDKDGKTYLCTANSNPQCATGTYCVSISNNGHQCDRFERYQVCTSKTGETCVTGNHCASETIESNGTIRCDFFEEDAKCGKLCSRMQLCGGPKPYEYCPYQYVQISCE